MWCDTLSCQNCLFFFLTSQKKKPHTTAPSASPRCRFTAEELYFNGKNHLTTREFYDVALIFFYCFFSFFFLQFPHHPRFPKAPDCEADTRWGNEFQTAAGFPTAASSHCRFISAGAYGRSW